MKQFRCRMTPSEFERQIARIETLLAGQDGKVTWNAQVKDPDNPRQRRQIDVLIERDGNRTLVECRNRSRPQDVTWVEELYGRKRSLQASAVIAVSSSGFTEGAVRKARSLGIVLRDFDSLTANEIQVWGKGTRTYLEYLQLGRAEINVVVPTTVIRGIMDRDMPLVGKEGSAWRADKAFKALANQLRGVQPREGVARIQIFPKEELFVGGIRIAEIIIQAEYKRLQVALLLPVVQVYGEPDQATLESCISIERAGPGGFEVLRSPSGVFLVVDLSVAEPVERSIFQAVEFDMGEPVPMRGIGIVGEIPSSVSAIPFSIRPIRSDSANYRTLMPEEGPGPLVHLP